MTLIQNKRGSDISNFTQKD